MTTSELKPCPFCGGTEIHFGPMDSPSAWECWVVGCNNYDCPLDVDSVKVELGTPEKAAAAWNTRATDANLAALQAEIERLRAEVERLRAEVARLEVIAGYGGVSSDAPERLILASEVYDGVQSCDKWCDVRRVVDDGQPMPESATAYVRADRAERLGEGEPR